MHTARHSHNDSRAVKNPFYGGFSNHRFTKESTMQTMRHQYHNRETANVDKFMSALQESARTEGGVFDSASASDFISTAQNQSTDIKIPIKLQAVLDEVGEEKSAQITRAIFDGINAYEKQHGSSAPADLVECALHAAYSTTQSAARRYALDNATSLQHNPLSLQPNRAVLAILSTMGEAIPFAHYLPADIGSNEARLAIMSHQAGSNFGQYAQGASMDGIHSGNTYISSSRIHAVNGAATMAGKLTVRQTSDETCDPAAGDLKLLRGRTIVYVQGRVAAREVDAAGAGNSTISGKITVEGVEYVLGGTINTDTGEFNMTSAPALPSSIQVVVEGFIDFERVPELTPSIITAVQTFALHAKPWRVTTHQTIDSRTQMSNELGLDPYSEGILSIHTQFANERHYEVLRKGLRLAALNVETFDFGAAVKNHDTGRSGAWTELAYPLGLISQKMAQATMSYGATHIYVTARVAAQLQALPSSLFQPSGLPPRAGIYRLGRLFGQYEVYFTPKVLNETPTSAQILVVGRAPDVARNPVVLGDAVSPTIIPLAVGADLRQGAGFYARNFTAVNPHDPSARGFAMMNVINM